MGFILLSAPFLVVALLKAKLWTRRLEILKRLSKCVLKRKKTEKFLLIIIPKN